MKKSDFYFDLPERLIAQHPLEQRDSSRMLVMDRKTGALSHRHFHDLIEYVKPGDCLVMNDSRRASWAAQRGALRRSRSSC